LPFHHRCGRLMGLAWDGVLRRRGARCLILLAAQQLERPLARCPAARCCARGQWFSPLEAPALQSLPPNALPWGRATFRNKLTRGFRPLFLAAVSSSLP